MAETLIWSMVYNEEKYLRATLDSIIAQSYKDWTLLISDNCSTDDSWAIINEYALRDKRVTFRSTPCRMAGITHSKFLWDTIAHDQKYTIHIGGHDLWGPQHLERLTERMKLHGELVAIVYSDTWVIDEHDAVVGHYKDVTEWGQLPAIMRPQTVIASVNSPQLFGLWNESVRRAVPFRHACSGWDHLIVMEASLHGSILYEDDTSLHLRAPKPGADLEDYGKRHLTADALAAGPADFLHQLDWCVRAVDVALEKSEIPPEARPMQRMFLIASIFGTYMALRGQNLYIIPGAIDAFNRIPEIQQAFAGLNHVDQNIRKLLGVT